MKIVKEIRKAYLGSVVQPYLHRRNSAVTTITNIVMLLALSNARTVDTD